MRVKHLTYAKCSRSFDVEVESYPNSFTWRMAKHKCCKYKFGYDGHRLAIHPTWFFGYRLACPYCGKSSKYDVSLR